MEKMLKRATGRAVAVLLAVIMVFAPFSDALGELGWLFAGASGDDSGDTVHSNTSYSNGEYSVLYGDILLVGSGFGRDISATLAATVGVGADRVKKLSSVNEAISQSGAGSLVVYACGTSEYSSQKSVLADAYAVTLTKEVENLKAKGADVLLVAPGPVVEYGAGMYYSKHTALWPADDIAAGSNITNFLSQYVDAICSVATEQNVGVLSLYDLAAIYGEEEYMSGTADGIYPADSGYALMTRWIAEYISEGYVISDGAVKSVTVDSTKSEVVIDLGAVYNDIDAVTVKVPANNSVPESLSVYTTKSKSDQWFEAVADVKSENTSTGVYSASLMFSASRAQYVRIMAEGGKLPAGTVISVHKTRLTNPVITYPAAGGEVTTKQAFNLEWSAVAGADRYEVTLKTGDTVVTSFTTGDDVQTVPKGILIDGTAYTVSVKSIRSGYTDLDAHSGTGSCAFTASENAPLSVSSESINENVSADKLFTVGEQSVISSGKGYTGADGDGKLTDGNYETVATTTGSALVCVTEYATDGVATITMDLSGSYDVSAVYFDTAFIAAVGTSNAKPKSVKVTYLGSDGNALTATRAMSSVSSVRTLTLGTGTAKMTRYIENIGASGVSKIQLTFELSDASEWNKLYLDEILVFGAQSGFVSAIARDGQTVLNASLSGAYDFNGNYQSGLWLTHHAFTALSAMGTVTPIELIVDLNKDAHNNSVSTGNHLVTGVDIGFAVDTDAICPSSIVVSVQQENSSEWVTVGGSIYSDFGTSSTPRYVSELIPLTSSDASDVKAARVKITFYVDRANADYGSLEGGSWGTWLALSHLRVNGGQYIGTVEPDGATAAYHANYLQNTDMTGRSNFGDVDNTDIWNTISWKSAQYTTANSGYLEATGNITVGKVYWASQPISGSASAKVDGGTTYAINPEVTGDTVKADKKIAISSISLDSTNAMSHANNTADISVLYDGESFCSYAAFQTVHPEIDEITDANERNKLLYSKMYKGQSSGIGVLKIALSESAVVTQLNAYVYSEKNSSNGLGNFAVKVSTDGNTWTNATITSITSTGTNSGSSSSYASTGYYGEVKIFLSNNTKAKYVLFQYQGTAWGNYLTEIEVYESDTDTAAPTISDVVVSEVSSDGYRITCTVTDNVGVTEVRFPTWTVKAGQTDAEAQDDVQWHTATNIGGNKWSYYVSVAEHNNESGTYRTHIYAYDAARNQAVVSAGDVTVPAAGQVLNIASNAGVTYAYSNMLPDEGVFHNAGAAFDSSSAGCLITQDYEKPNYSATLSDTDFSKGGTGHRTQMDYYAAGKLNDGVEAQYSAGVTPLHYVGWAESQNSGKPMTITFDLCKAYKLTEVYFNTPTRGNYANANQYTVTYYFSADNVNWTAARAGTWTANGTVPYSKNNSTAISVYKNSVTAPSGSYRFVKIVIANNSISNTDNLIYIDEIKIYADVGEATEIDTNEYNWALSSKGGQYKGVLGTLYSSTYNTEDNWDVYHNGKLNNGTIATVTPGPNNTTDYIEVQRTWQKTLIIVYQLSELVDVTNINVYTATRETSSNRDHPDSVEAYVVETEEQALNYANATAFGTSYLPTTYNNSSYTKKFAISGTATGKYVAIIMNCTADSNYITPITEIEIIGRQSLDLTTPTITSHYDGQEVGFETELEWDTVTAPNGAIVSYTVTVTDKDGNTVTVVSDCSTNRFTLSNFGGEVFTAGEGDYTITVTAKANGWLDSTSSVNVYYSPKYIVRFYAVGDGLITSGGTSASYVQFAFAEGSDWSDEDVRSAVSGVSATPYIKNGTVMYFSNWSDSDGVAVTVPTSGAITSNYNFYASYNTVDTMGTMSNTRLTDGVVYNGNGNRGDYTFAFINNTEAYDYLIIDLGAIYYSLTEFDVSFYQMGSKLPFQITFEVSSKLYVPTIAQGAAFTEDDWQYVAVVTENEYKTNSNGGCSFIDSARIARIIEGAFGRYIRVKFWYSSDCEGVYVDEVIVNGSDDYVRTNVAAGKTAAAGTDNAPVLTDGATTSTVTAKEFTVDLGAVKAGLYSFELVGATEAATLYVSAGGTSANDFHKVETISGNSSYKLSDKTSARLVRVVFENAQTVSEFRVYADAGRENYYTSTENTTEIELANGTTVLDNVISLGAVPTITANGATVSGGNASVLTDGKDPGFANGSMLAQSGNYKLWYNVYKSKVGSDYVLNMRIVTDWTPKLDSTAFTAVIGSKTYKFEFNGDINKGFVVLQSGSATPNSYSGVREDNAWVVDFTVLYNDIGAKESDNITYTVTAYEGTASVVTTGSKTFNGKYTDGWDYNNTNSTWKTVTATTDNTVTVTLDLGKTYYGINKLAVTVLEGAGYSAPKSVLFQTSDDNSTWHNAGYTTYSEIGDYRYYPQQQTGYAKAYNLSVSFAGASARYVRAVLTTNSGASTAIQEFWVNAYDEPPKESGGDSAQASFDYKMLWDDDNLYIAFRYEEDEVPFYTANHQYYETYSVEYTTGDYTTEGNVVTPAEGTPLNAFSISNLFFEQDTDYFRLDHTVTRIGDDNTVTDGYYKGYSTKRLDNFKLYKVSSVTFNKGASVTNGRIQYGSATLATSIETSSIVTANNDNGKDSIGSGSVLNGYILVSDGYALSQQIGGYSLTPVPVTVDGNTIHADQISDDLVWYFEKSSDVASLPATAKALGEYHVYALCRESKDATDGYQYYMDLDTKMAYKKFYLNRAKQGEMWENVYTFRSGLADLTSLNTDEATYSNKNQYFPGNNNWNFDYNSTTGMWSIYLRSQGKLSYGNAYDNIDGASALRIFLSAANLNDTARYDYGNYDIVIDAYVLDDNELILSDGTVLPLDSTLPSKYYHSNHKSDYNTAWNGYKTVELKATALGMTPETNDYAVDFDTYQAKAKFSQSENGQSVLTVEIAIPFSQLGFTMEKENGVVTKWGNFYTKTGIEHPLGKRTLMQFDADYSYTKDNKPTDDTLAEIDEFYYYVDASEFGFILQYAPEGKGYQDLSYTDGEGYSTVSSVRGEVLNTTNGTEIEYTPTTFEISKILSTREDNKYADILAELADRDAFTYVEEDGIYYFTSQYDQERTFNQRGTISTEVTIPAGGAYFSFDWRVDSEPGADTLSFWLEETDTWNTYYKDWIATYNCSYPFRTLTAGATNDNGSVNTSLESWTGIIDWNDSSKYDLYSNILHDKGFTIKNGGVQIRNDACVAVISGYEDTTRAPEQYQLSIWKEGKRSYTGSDYPAGTEANVVPVNVDDTLVFSPLTDATNGRFTHVWDWNNVTVWIPNTSGSDISYTLTWMYWKNGTMENSFSATDGRGDDSAQITNFRLSTTDELGYWKNSENWDTLRLDATIADPTDTMLGVKQLAKTTVKEGEMTPVISATTNDPANSVTNTFGKEGFFSLSYAAIAQKDVVGTTTQTTTYAQTKNRLSISAANVPVADIPSYKNNAIVFTQDYAENLTETGVLNDWTVLELKYNSLYNTWVVSRLFEEGVDKTKFNIYADNNTIVIAVNYYYSKNPGTAYGETSEAIFFGYQNREVLRMITPQLRYTQSADGERIVETDADTEQLEVTQLITSNIFVRENYNIATGKMYSLRNNPTYTDATYQYMENWFRENNTEDSLAAFLAVYSETPLYYVSKNGEIDGMDDTDGDYTKAFVYNYNSYSQFATAMGLTNRPMRFDTNQYGNVLYVPAGVGQLTDGKKMSVYSNKYLLQTLEEYAIGYFVSDTVGTPDADTVENIYPEDRVYSYQQEVDLKHDMYEVFEDVHTREENIILDLGTVEYGLSAFNIRFLGGGEDGVSFPTSVEFSISTDGLSYSYIGSVALDDTGYNSKIFEDAYATIVFSGATDTVYGNTVADYTFNLQTVGVTARYIKATIMNHSAQNAKTFITEYQVIQNAVCPDKLPTVSSSSWIDVSADANLMYIDTLEKWDNSLNKSYSFALAPTTAGYLFAEDEGYPDIDGHNTAGIYKAGELTDGEGGSRLYKYSEEGNTAAVPTIQEIKDMSVGWMKAYAPEVSLTFDLGEQKEVGYVCVYALQSKDSVDKITQPYNITAYVAESENSDWLKVATVNAKDNDSSEVTLKGVDVVLDVDGTGQEGVGGYTIYKYTLAFARDGELAQQISNMRYVKVVAETDGGEDGWICLTEVEVFEGHPCYPVYDLTDSKYEKTALGLTDEQKDNQVSEVRPTFFRGYYDSDLYADELPAYTYNGNSGSYNKKYVFNREESEDYTVGYVFGNVEQRALDGRGVPYFYGGDQLIFRVTNDQLNCNGYDYHGDWVSSYKLLAESRIYYTSVGETSSVTTRLFTTIAVPTPMTRCNVLARDKFTCDVPADYNWEDSYYYLPIYLMNSLDYLKNSGYLGNNGTEQYICMPANKVELTGDLVWDTNYESDYAEYADDKNGISLNLAPLGAKTNTETVTYNSKEYAPATSLRFGSIWYIDDSAYYNTHTHMQQYGTLVMTTKNLGKYFTDSFGSTSKYTSVFKDYGLKLTKLDGIQEVTGVQQITGVTEVVKLTNVNEVIKLTGVTELEGAEGAKFTLIIDGTMHYYTCNEDIHTVDGVGRVWTGDNNYWYCANSSVGTYKFTYNGKYYYCKENVSTVNYEKDGSFFYCSESGVENDDNVYTATLNDGTTVYYYCASGEQTAIKSMTRDSSGTAMYWTYNENYPSWTFVKVEDDVSKYYYSASYNGVAGNYICKDGIYYATSSTVVYGEIIEKDGEYWGGKTKQAYDMLVSVYETVGNDIDNEEKVMTALDTFLDYINKYGEGRLASNGAYEDFGGIAINSRANKYYYFTNISTHLVPDSYDGDTVNNPLYDTDSQKDKQNCTDLIGVYNYDQRYLEFDAIIAGIPESQKDSKIVAVPYVIYANNYEFLEFGEHLGEGDQYYVESTWHEIFSKYYGGELSGNDMRYYVYGGGVARSINDVINAQADLNKQYN